MMTDWNLPPEREGIPAPDDLAALRGMIAGAVSAGTWRTNPPAEEATYDGVRVLRFAPAGPAKATILHIHGGGFRLGCPEMVGQFAAALADRCQVEIICPQYRLAPEYPFPAGLTDVYRVAVRLRAEGRDRLIISGDSAGGGLAASLTLRCVEERKAPLGLILLSAWLDLTVSSDSYDTNAAKDPLFSRSSAKQAADLYLQGFDPHHPSASPLHGDLATFPPTLISVGAGEVLADDSRHFHSTLLQAGIPAHLSEMAGMDHVAVTRDLSLPGSAETFDIVADFVDRLL